MQKEGPIGIFDSGVGGTSIWGEIIQLLPNESTLYLADSAHAPYGQRSPDEIIALSIKNTEKLLSLGAKIIVVACNTATTNAIAHLRSTYDVPFIGIEPAIKPAALLSKNKTVGILATKGTLNSQLFSDTSEKYAQDIKIIEVIGEGLAPLIESGKLDTPELKELLAKYLEPMIKAQIDYLVLGCSHYPYLIPTLKTMLPETVTIIDSGEAVALQTKAVLKKNDLLATSDSKMSHHLYSNSDLAVLEDIVARFCARLESGHLSTPTKVSYLDF